MGRRIRTEQVSLTIFVFLVGGFLGGYVFGVLLGLAPYQSFVGWSPFVIGSGLVLGAIAHKLQKRNQQA